MPLTASGKPIEHIQFFNGQRLFASDLQDLEEFNRSMRWLHNQSLHQPGVASGYAVAGNKGDSQITIEPGYAIDSQGRELVLTKPLVVQVPPVAGDGRGNAVYYDFVVSYPADRDLKETETRDGICVARHAVRLREEPAFCWAELVPTDDLAGTSAAMDAPRKAKLTTLNQDIESGRRIRLARAEVLNCKLNQPLSIAERRNARPAVQPYVFAGNTKGLTNHWDSVLSGVGITVTQSVDTSAAKFRSVPRYFVNITGDRVVPIQIDGAPAQVIVDGFVRIDPVLATPSAFTVSVMIPAILIDRDLDLNKVATALKTALNTWSVVWMGVEG